MPRRYELTDEQWEKIRDLPPGREGTVGVTASDNRTFVTGVLWVLRSGARWRDLPERYGPWKKGPRRFTRWAPKGIWERIFSVLTQEADNDSRSLDSNLVRAQQHAAGASNSSKKTRLWGVPEAN